MKPTPSHYQAPSLFSGLEDMLDMNHPLCKLADKIDWQTFEDAFTPLYCPDNGRPPKPIRLMVGLLILKHVRNISDESVVGQWAENAYYQYFCGMQQFCATQPCAASELVHFRHRIGESGVELILKESIRVNDEDEPHHSGRGRKPEAETTAFIDSTVQEKNITFPTDCKLLLKAIGYCHKAAAEEGIRLRQTYNKEIKKLKRVMRFRGKAKSKNIVAKADRRLRTIAGRLVRELLRNLPPESAWLPCLGIALKFVNGEKIDGHKIYSLHEPEVVCIAKGKDRVKYEFGNKVSIVRTQSGLVIGALSFRNEYDGHTIDRSMEQVRRIYPHPINLLAGDRGYRGQSRSGNTEVVIPDSPQSTDSPYKKRKKHSLFRKRAGIEPVIGHLKTDHRLCRNFYKGIFGDSVNVMLSAAAFNFKRAMRALFYTLFKIQEGIRISFISAWQAKERSYSSFVHNQTINEGPALSVRICRILQASF